MVTKDHKYPRGVDVSLGTVWIFKYGVPAPPQTGSDLCLFLWLHLLLRQERRHHLLAGGCLASFFQLFSFTTSMTLPPLHMSKHPSLWWTHSISQWTCERLQLGLLSCVTPMNLSVLLKEPWSLTPAVGVTAHWYQLSLCQASLTKPSDGVPHRWSLWTVTRRSLSSLLLGLLSSDWFSPYSVSAWLETAGSEQRG